MSTQPKTLRALCEAATPGPECPECAIAAKKYANIDRRMAARGNFGIVPASPVCEKHFGESRRIQVARSQIHARLSPEVVLRWYRLTACISCIGLHQGDERGPCLCSQCERTKEARAILAILDGQTSNGDTA